MLEKQTVSRAEAKPVVKFRVSRILLPLSPWRSYFFFLFEKPPEPSPADTSRQKEKNKK